MSSSLSSANYGLTTKKPRRKHSKYDVLQPTQNYLVDGVDSNTCINEMLAEFNLRPFKSRTTFTDKQIVILESTFQRLRCPNPSQRLKLSEVVGLDEPTVRIWFQNRRAKEKRDSEDQLAAMAAKIKHTGTTDTSAFLIASQINRILEMSPDASKQANQSKGKNVEPYVNKRKRKASESEEAIVRSLARKAIATETNVYRKEFHGVNENDPLRTNGEAMAKATSTEAEEQLVLALVRESIARDDAVCTGLRSSGPATLSQAPSSGLESDERTQKQSEPFRRNVDEYLQGLSARLALHAENLKPIKPPSKASRKQSSKNCNSDPRQLNNESEQENEPARFADEGSLTLPTPMFPDQRSVHSYILNSQRPSVIVSPQHTRRSYEQHASCRLPQSQGAGLSEVGQDDLSQFVNCRVMVQDRNNWNIWNAGDVGRAPVIHHHHPAKQSDIQLQSRILYQKQSVTRESFHYAGDTHLSSAVNYGRQMFSDVCLPWRPAYQYPSSQTVSNWSQTSNGTFQASYNLANSFNTNAHFLENPNLQHVTPAFIPGYTTFQSIQDKHHGAPVSFMREMHATNQCMGPVPYLDHPPHSRSVVALSREPANQGYFFPAHITRAP